MLLAVLGMAQAGHLARNEIRFEPPLLERYMRFFDIVRGPSDRPNPYFPYFHLKGDRFWYLKPIHGREAIAASLKTVRSYSEITSNFEYAFLDDDLHRLVLDSGSRAALRDELLVKWFGFHRLALEQALTEESRIDAYETTLRATVFGTPPFSLRNLPCPRAAPHSGGSSARCTITAARLQDGASSFRTAA